jgi:hypothetical protein
MTAPLTTWFSPAEIVELTSKRKWSAQRRALSRMGIPFLTNAVGRPLVNRQEIRPHTLPVQRKASEPRWEEMHHGA